MKISLNIAAGLMILFSSAIVQAVHSTHKEFPVNIQIINNGQMSANALQFSSNILTPLHLVNFLTAGTKIPFAPVSIVVLPGTSSITYGYDQGHFCEFEFTMLPNGNISSYKTNTKKNVQDCKISVSGEAGQNTVVSITIESIPQSVDKNFVPTIGTSLGKIYTIHIKNEASISFGQPLITETFPLLYHQYTATPVIIENTSNMPYATDLGVLPNIKKGESHDIPARFFPNGKVTLQYGIDARHFCTFKIFANELTEVGTSETPSVTSNGNDNITCTSTIKHSHDIALTVSTIKNWLPSALCLRNHDFVGLQAHVNTDGIVRYNGNRTDIDLDNAKCWDYYKEAYVEIYGCNSDAGRRYGSDCYHKETLRGEIYAHTLTSDNVIQEGLMVEANIRYGDNNSGHLCFKYYDQGDLKAGNPSMMAINPTIAGSILDGTCT